MAAIATASISDLSLQIHQLMSDQDKLESFRSKIINEFGARENEGDKLTTRQWMERTYQRMHQIAMSQMSLEKKDHTLSATALIHEVFVRLQSRERDDLLAERQFLGIVASEMKRTLVDSARRKLAAKRGGGHQKREFDEMLVGEELVESISDLNEAVEQFEKIAPQAAELVRLRYFLGLSEVEAANLLGISRSTASRKWAFARAWLLNYMTG